MQLLSVSGWVNCLFAQTVYPDGVQQQVADLLRMVLGC